MPALLLLLNVDIAASSRVGISGREGLLCFAIVYFASYKVHTSTCRIDSLQRAGNTCS